MGAAIGRFSHWARTRFDWASWAIILMLGCWLCFPGQARAAAEVSREYRFKAAVLYWLSNYVEWPPSAFAAKDSPLVIGLLGPDPFRDALEKLFDKKVGGREVKVVRFDALEKVRDCHILYVNLPDRRDVQQALDMFRGKPVLTVSDQDAFNAQGGMVSILKYKNHLKPYINNTAARRAGLTIDSRLLTVSEITDQ